jgi:hypothetical protein
MFSTPVYRGAFYSKQQAAGDIVREIFDGLRTGRQDALQTRERDRVEAERQQLRADRLEERAYLRGRDAKADARQAIADNIAQLRERLALEKEGVFHGSMPENPVEFATVGRSFIEPGGAARAIAQGVESTPYRDLGNGYYRDERKTPEALAENHRRMIAGIAQKAMQGDSSAMAEAVANGFDVSGLDPTRRAGTPQYLAAQRAELELRDQFNAREQARQVAGQLRVARDGRAADAIARAAETAASAAKPVVATEGERKIAGLLEIARSTVTILDNAPTPSRGEKFAQRIGLNEALDDKQQEIEQAGLMLADAYIRYTSGANAPEPEVMRTAKMLTPMPGDSPATLQRKSEARKTVMRAMAIGAGRLVGSVTPESAPAGGSTTSAMGNTVTPNTSALFAAPSIAGNPNPFRR